MYRAVARRIVTVVGPRLDGTLPRLRDALTRGLTVFIFHDVTDRPSSFQAESGFYSRPDRFRRQLAWITARFEVVDPRRLPQLGGDGEFPPNAALVSFDDSWAGVFRTALPIMAEAGLPAVCFVNMGTIAGDPDLAAVRRYERAVVPPEGPSLPDSLDTSAAERALARIRERYGADGEFHRYTGEIATADDLAAIDGGVAWLGSHLYHHWHPATISEEVYERSLRDNATALAGYANRLPVFATPYGYAGGDGPDVSGAPLRCGELITFTGTGNQNDTAGGPVLDRVYFAPGEPSTNALWYATHRRRVVGRRAS